MKPTSSASSTPLEAPHGNIQQPMTDRELAQRVAQGGPDASAAYSQLYRRYASDILAFLSAHAPHGTPAEDVAQEVWIIVYQKLNTFDGTNFRAWLYQIARNRTIDKMRESKRRKEVGSNDFAELIESSIEEDERLLALQDCLQQLDGPFIRTLISYRLDGLSVEELAKQEQIQVATIYTRIDRAKRQLSECVQRKLS